MRALDFLNLIKAPEKAPAKPKPKWIGLEPVGPDPLRDKPKVQSIDQAAFVQSAITQIDAYVNGKIIPGILEKVEERLGMTTEDKQTLDTAIGELKTFSETYRATRITVADLRKQLADANTQLADANARFSAIQAQAEKDKSDLEDHKSKLAAVKAAFQD